MYVSEGPFGKTEQFYAVIDGDVDELAEARHGHQDPGRRGKVLTKDDEEAIEAEGHVTASTSSHPGTELRQKLRIRYAVWKAAPDERAVAVQALTGLAPARPTA